MWGLLEFQEDFVQDIQATQTVDQCFIGQANAVEDDVFGECEEVFRNDVVSSMNKGSGTGGLHQGDAGTGAGAQLDFFVMSCAADRFDTMFDEDFADMNFLNFRHDLNQGIHIGHRITRYHVESGLWDGSLFFALQS